MEGHGILKGPLQWVGPCGPSTKAPQGSLLEGQNPVGAGAAPEYGAPCEEQRDQVWAAGPQRQESAPSLLGLARLPSVSAAPVRTGPCSVHGPTARPAGPPAAQEAEWGWSGAGDEGTWGAGLQGGDHGPAAPSHSTSGHRGCPPLSQQDGRSSHLTSRGAESELQASFSDPG